MDDTSAVMDERGGARGTKPGPHVWRRAMDAEEGERARMADEIHDNVIQPMAAALLGLDLAAVTLERGQPDDARRAILRSRSIVRGAFLGLREILFDLRPPSLDAAGVASAASSLVARFRENTGVKVRLEGQTPRLHPDAELALYRTLEAALANVRRHDSVSSVEVRFGREDGRVVLTVRDDGVDPGEGPPNLEEDALGTAASRLDWVGGGLSVDALPEGGTAVAAFVPVSSGS